MEDDAPEAGRRRRGGATPRREGPRGRGLGAPTTDVVRCATCGRQAAPAAADEFDAVCAACGADLHTCTNCRHFDSSAPLECRKPVPERIGAKAASNECELFEAKVTQEIGSDSGRPDDPKAAFDALFDL